MLPDDTRIMLGSKMVYGQDGQFRDAGPGAPDQDSSDEWSMKLNCTFSADIFDQVMLNLIKSPNLTSTFLFRADILLDTTDCKFIDQLQSAYRPRPFSSPGWTLERTIVRELIPRNVQADDSLIQTCHLLSRESERMVVYIPHIDSPDDVPYYHPKVRTISFYYQDGALTLRFDLFGELTDRIQRTGLKLIQTIHKHGQGVLEGYEKRVHHDQLVPQRQYQDTYTRLKVKYSKKLVEGWVEVTDPGKHVFEDIGIAAFLIELWRGYDICPGFVDIGCGNGLLTYLLVSEGYDGNGYDARQRKTWSIFPPEVQARLHQKILVPSVLGGDDLPSGAFIISNHADELTAWTPLLAILNGGAFMALPCCSHDLSGQRFRAPVAVKAERRARLPQQHTEASKPTQAAETGSLKRTLVQKKMASAYSTLCSYVESLAAHVGFEVEREVLRIPSTRNHAIIGRKSTSLPEEDRRARVTELLEEELGMNVESIAKAWMENAEKIAKKPGSGH